MIERPSGELIQLARESRIITRSSLAARIGVSQPLVSMIESGLRVASRDLVKKIARVLDYPWRFFYERPEYSGVGLSIFFFRKRCRTTVSAIRRLEAEISVITLRTRRLVYNFDITPAHPLRKVDMDEEGLTPEEVALKVRSDWRMPRGPIRNLVHAIELAGGLVFKLPFGTSDIDAISKWDVHGLPPLFFMNSESPPDRLRFSLAHELGHVVMHEEATGTMEEEADRFAAELLMPSDQIGPFVSDMSRRKAAALKPAWGVSMAALIRRSYDLGYIQKSRYISLFQWLSQTGQRKREAIEILEERPQLVSHLVSSMKGDKGHTREEIMTLLLTEEDDFVRQFERQGDTNLRVRRGSGSGNVGTSGDGKPPTLKIV